MARFDVYRPQAAVLLLDVQAHRLEELGRRVVVPLQPVETCPQLVSGLHPVFVIDGREVALMTQRLGAAPKRRLGAPIHNLAEYRDEIIRALDILFTGF